MPSNSRKDKRRRRRLSDLTEGSDGGGDTSSQPRSSPKRPQKKRAPANGPPDGDPTPPPSGTVLHDFGSEDEDDNGDNDDDSDTGLGALQRRIAIASGTTPLTKDKQRYIERYGDMSPQKVLGE